VSKAAVVTPSVLLLFDIVLLLFLAGYLLVLLAFVIGVLAFVQCGICCQHFANCVA